MDVEITFPLRIKVYDADYKALAIILVAEILALLIILSFKTKYQQAIKNKKEQL